MINLLDKGHSQMRRSESNVHPFSVLEVVSVDVLKTFSIHHEKLTKLIEIVCIDEVLSMVKT